jgi:hypothetical protein
MTKAARECEVAIRLIARRPETLLLRRLLSAAQAEAATELEAPAHSPEAYARALAMLKAWLAPQAGRSQ